MRIFHIPATPPNRRKHGNRFQRSDPSVEDYNALCRIIPGVWHRITVIIDFHAFHDLVMHPEFTESHLEVAEMVELYGER